MALAVVLLVVALLAGNLAPYPADVVLAVVFGLAGLWVLLRSTNL